MCSSPAEAVAVESQLKLVARPMYSNPPLQGAKVGGLWGGGRGGGGGVWLSGVIWESK